MMEDATETLAVERTIVIRATLDEVWHAITTPESFARWYAFGGASIDLRVGGAVRLHWEEHGTFLGRVEAAMAPKRFSYRLAVVPDTEPTPTNSTFVAFQLEQADAGTRLTVRESGYDTIDPAYGLPEDLPTLAGQGWDGGFVLLKRLVETAS